MLGTGNAIVNKVSMFFLLCGGYSLVEYQRNKKERTIKKNSENSDKASKHIPSEKDLEEGDHHQPLIQGLISLGDIPTRHPYRSGTVTEGILTIQRPTSNFSDPVLWTLKTSKSNQDNPRLFNHLVTKLNILCKHSNTLL